MNSSLRSQRGNAFIEYFVIALAVLLGAIAFYDSGNFQGAKGQVEDAFDTLVERVAP